jgi:hypothetical protein
LISISKTVFIKVAGPLLMAAVPRIRRVTISMNVSIIRPLVGEVFGGGYPRPHRNWDLWHRDISLEPRSRRSSCWAVLLSSGSSPPETRGAAHDGGTSIDVQADVNQSRSIPEYAAETDGGWLVPSWIRPCHETSNRQRSDDDD